MMKVVGEEGTSIEDYIIYLKSEFLDAAYLQQNAFDPVDGVTSGERQVHVYALVREILENPFDFKDRGEALQFFQTLRQAFVDWNYEAWDTESFTQGEEQIRQLLAKDGSHAESL
jgi:V/A-type H+-transporting ATPase subunit A